MMKARKCLELVIPEDSDREYVYVSIPMTYFDNEELFERALWKAGFKQDVKYGYYDYILENYELKVDIGAVYDPLKFFYLVNAEKGIYHHIAFLCHRCYPANEDSIIIEVREARDYARKHGADALSRAIEWFLNNYYKVVEVYNAENKEVLRKLLQISREMEEVRLL